MRERTALVLGANGDQGWPQVLRLARAGYHVRAACRAPQRLREKLAASNSSDVAAVASRIEAVAVDYAKLDNLTDAMAGVAQLLVNFSSSSFHDGDAQIEAAHEIARVAAASNIRTIAFNTSLPLPPTPLGFPAQDVRFAQRDALRASGIPTVSIQPVVYMDNLLRGWTFPGIVERRQFEYPHARDLEVAWLSQDDLAAIMQSAIEHPELADQNFNVGGAEILRGGDVAQALSEVIGDRIEFRSLPIEEFGARMGQIFARDATLDATRLVSELVRIYRWYNGSPTRPFRVNPETTARTFGVGLTPFRAWAARQRWA
jgi:uncharacterized protein YbjT (DUF2867 family)